MSPPPDPVPADDPAAPLPRHVPPRAGGMFITLLGAAQVCSWGSLYYAFPLIAEAMSTDLGWSKTELYGAATLGLALAGLAAYPIGAAIDAGRGRLIMSGGSLLAGALLILWAYAGNMALFYLAVAGIGAMQAATLYDPVFAVIARRAGPLHARAGITAITMWGGFASTVFIPLVHVLIASSGWRETLLVLGLINILVCAALNFAAIDPSRDAPRPHMADHRAETRALMKVVLKQPVFWALTIAFTAYAATFSGFTFHLYPLLIERGFDIATVVTAMAIMGPAQVAGRLLIWLALPNAPVKVVGSVIVAVFPVAFLALEFMPPSFYALAAFAVGFGAVNGIMTIVRGLVVPEMLTRRAYGAVNGALTIPATIARALSPAGLALLWAVAGSYDAVLAAVVIGSIVLAIGFWSATVLSGRSTIPN